MYQSVIVNSAEFTKLAVHKTISSIQAKMQLTLVWNNESRLSDLALALLEDDNGEDDGDAHAENLDAQHHSP
jgi:hypothetical protein